MRLHGPLRRVELRLQYPTPKRRKRKNGTFVDFSPNRFAFSLALPRFILTYMTLFYVFSHIFLGVLFQTQGHGDEIAEEEAGAPLPNGKGKGK